jgi:hypothetical protein
MVMAASQGRYSGKALGSYSRDKFVEISGGFLLILTEDLRSFFGDKSEILLAFQLTMTSPFKILVHLFNTIFSVY